MEQEHKISFWTAILTNMNIMIGVGIFAFPVLMAQKAGNASFLGWILVALVFLPLVLSIATMARLFPGASFYEYSKSLIGPTAGFTSGWAFYLAYTGIGALMTIIVRDTVVFPSFPMSPILFNFIFIAFLTLLSLVNIKTVGRIQNTGVFFKVLPLLFVLAVFAFYWNPSFHISTANLIATPSIIPMCVFGYWGFEVCCSISHLIKGKKENASRAILVSFFLVATLYTLFHFGLLHIMGAKNLAALNTKDFVEFLGLGTSTLKSIIQLFVSFSLSIAFANAIFSIITATSATLQTMASKNLFPYSNHLVKLGSNHRPWVAILFQGAIMFAITCATNNLLLLTSLINFGILTAFLLTLISLALYQKRNKLYSKMIVTGLAFCSWTAFTYFSWFDVGANTVERLMSLSVLAGAMVAGLVMYFYKKNSCKQAIPPSGA